MLPTKLIIITIFSVYVFCPAIESLPITSKPIESTAENLAWEAWLMVPIGQHQKTRKVTPKSIFIVPQKKNQTAAITCPPGEHYYESRCIPTVNIDTDKILLNQLTNLVYPTGDYDYDYDETESNLPESEKLEGEGETDLLSTSVLDSADEPLKFDIFRDNFPIGSSGSGDSSGIKEPDEEQLLFIGERRRRPPLHAQGSLPDLDTDSSSHGIYNESTDSDNKEGEEEATLFLSNIDAILVPAGTPHEENLNFSVYRDVNNDTTPTKLAQLEIISSIAEKSKNLEKILKDESLILDENHESEEKGIVTTTERAETASDMTEEPTTTMRIEDEYENGEVKMEFTRSVVEDTSISPMEITSTLAEKEADVATTLLPNDESTTKEETTLTTNSKSEIVTMDTTETEVETMLAITDLPSEKPELEAELLPEQSDDRFFYHQIRDQKHPSVNSTDISSTSSSTTITSTPSEIPKETAKSALPATPPAIDFVAELKLINDLVAKKNPLPVTSTVSSVESSSSDSWTKIIPTTVGSSTIASNTSTSSTTLSSSSSTSSRISASTTPFTDTDRTSPIASTSPKPALAESDPFWWLPNGWRTDRTDTDRPLLLRFWSALSSLTGSQAKV